MATPVFRAAQAGIIGTASAVAGSAQVNQFLGAHSNQAIYQGASILTPDGTGGAAWAYQLSTVDMDQPFTMSGTTIGRVVLPLLAVGNGADLLVSLCSDNSGSPGAMITQARIPASWPAQLGAVSGIAGPSSQSPILQYTNSPVATAQFNAFHMGATSQQTWSYPTSGTGGPASGPTSVYYDSGSGFGYYVQMGGSNGTTFFSDVYTIPFDSAGNISKAVPQPAMPSVSDGSAGGIISVDPSSGACTLIHAGGSQVSGSLVSSVFAAPFNPATGTVGAWSTQTSLPATNQFFSMAAYNGYVYALGGANPGVSTVYVSQVQNGQLSAWKATTPLPGAYGFATAGVVGGFLYFVGGFISSATAAVYYAYINANGTLGPWLPGPSLPVANYTLNGQSLVTMPPYGALIPAVSNDFSMLSATTNGPDASWQIGNTSIGGNFFAAAAAGVGQWQYYGLFSTNYTRILVSLTPRISVPLPATGLTNGATYHVLMQQQGGDLNNYLRLHTDKNIFPGNPTVLTSPRNGYTWTAGASGFGVPLQIYDQTVTGPPVHTWEDAGLRVSTLVNATTPDQRLLGLAEATRTLVQRNSNSGFESGISPWQVFNGTVVQSSTQAKEGLFSAQITPNGTSSQVFIQSELLPCLPGQQITVSGWFWFTNAVTTNTSLSINWYTAGGTLISTSSNSVSVSAATWTQLTNTFTAPTGGTLPYQYGIVPTLGGTPAAGQIWYVDQVYATDNVTLQQSSVVQVQYPGTYPSGTFPPLGVNELA